MPYDQWFKELLRAFFPDFIGRFFPDAAAKLDLRQITFLEQEASTDVGRGRRREMDLVAQVATRAGTPRLVLLHIELQARPEQGFPWRMFEYYALLRRRHRMRVLPIVVYITGGRGTDNWEVYQEDWFDEEILRFRYRRLRLRGLKAMQVAQENSPLASALATLMDRRGADLAALKATSLQRIGQAHLDEARQWLLLNFVETYLPLDAAAAQRFQQILAQQEYGMAKRVQTTWGDRLRLEGEQKGLLRGKKDAVLSVLRSRFQTVSEDLTRLIEKTQDPKELDALLERAATASRLDDVRGPHSN
jgi:hypothetical protein